MSQERVYRYTHVEAGLVENVVIRRTTDTDAYPSGWKYTVGCTCVKILATLWGRES